MALLSRLRYIDGKPMKVPMSETKHKDHVCSKASTILGKNLETHRRNVLGNDIYYHSYGKDSSIGWHLDHKKPKEVRIIEESSKHSSPKPIGVKAPNIKTI
jgi:hypothetical protein